MKTRSLWFATHTVITQVKSLRFANYFVETQHPSLPPTHCPDHDCFLQDTSSGNRITGTTGQSCPTQSPLGADILCMQITNMLRLRSWWKFWQALGGCNGGLRGGRGWWSATLPLSTLQNPKVASLHFIELRYYLTNIYFTHLARRS